MEQAVGGLWFVFTLVLTDQRHKEDIFVFKGLQSLDFFSFGMAPGIKDTLEHRKVIKNGLIISVNYSDQFF